MAEKATIQLELSSWSDDFVSNTVELAGFEWYFSGRSRLDDSYNCQIQNMQIHCSPIGEMKSSIWNCETFGQVVVFASKPSTQRSKLWSKSYDFRHLSSEPTTIDFKDLFPRNTYFRFIKSGSGVYRIDLLLNAFSHKIIDLSVRDNPMIASSDDAAQVRVEEETLWLSKSILSDSCHFFKAFFNSNFKEKRTGVYKLKEIDLEQFLHFVSLLYGVRVRIDGDSVEYLLKLADYFQCDVIIDRCRDYLFHSDELSAEKKLKLADRYGFFDVVAKVVQKMDAAELKNCVGVAGFTSSTFEILYKRLDEFVALPQ